MGLQPPKRSLEDILAQKEEKAISCLKTRYEAEQEIHNRYKFAEEELARAVTLSGLEAQGLIRWCTLVSYRYPGMDWIEILSIFRSVYQWKYNDEHPDR